MDALDKYKKAWNNQSQEPNKVSKVDIYKMAQSKSSSIVKWIFVIGLLELIIPSLIYLFVDLEKPMQEYEKMGLRNFIYYSQIVVYIVILYFLFLFYKNYRAISAVESTKTLMQKILKTRKTVRNYVIFNLSYLLLIIFIVGITIIKLHFHEFSSKQLFIAIAATIVIASIAIGLFWLFYQLLYGILLQKLNRNYKELAKLDELN